MITGTAPKRDASWGMRVPKASMPIGQQAETMPMVSLSTPCARGPAAPAAADAGLQPDRGAGGEDRDEGAPGTRWRGWPGGLLGDTEMTLRAERRRLRRLDLAFGRGGGFLLARHMSA